MLSEKHNDRYGWKNKLEGLSSLPGEAPLEKNAAWEKLHSRLQERPRTNKAVWYWAAACLLIALIIPLMTANKKENIVVRNDPPQKQQIITTQNSREVPVTVQVTVPVEKKKPETRIRKDQHINDIKNIVKQEEPLTTIAETIIEKDPVAIIADTVSAVATAMPVKKKLSVVHINELGSPTVQFYPLSNYVQRSFKIKFKNGKATNQTIASQQEYEGGFKVKLSQKN